MPQNKAAALHILLQQAGQAQGGLYAWGLRSR